MQYLSKEIEALAKNKEKTAKSLVKKQNSCGIFQDVDMLYQSSTETGKAS